MTKQFLLVFAAVALAHGTFPALAAGEDPPLVVAASKGDIVQVRRLLANGTDPNAHDTGNLTALNWAAYNGHLAVVQALVERGATVDSNSNSHGWTPLMNAANRGHTDVVKYLLSRGADARLASKDGYVMAIGYAVLGGHDDTAHVLRNSAAGAMHYGGNEVVLFINNSSSVVAVSLDGKQVCSLNPGGRCHGGS
jgi:ankyrin repeat protein